MSNDWTRLSGFVTNIATAPDLGHRYASYEKIAGKSATDILKQVDKILQSTNVLLENHKDYLPANQFTEFKRAYCRYHWQMTNESQEDRAYYDKRIQESRILSQLYANRLSHHDRAKKLLREVETYQTRVLSASRNVQPPDSLALFDDELPDSSTDSRDHTRDSYTSWFSVLVGTSRSTSTDHEAVEPAPAYETEEQGFIVSITHFPTSATESNDAGIDEVGQTVVGTGGNIYRRMIAFENKDKRIEIKDPRLYALSTNETYVAEDTLLAMSELGQKLLNQSDPGMSQTPQIADSPSQNLSLETTIQKLTKMSTASNE